MTIHSRTVTPEYRENYDKIKWGTVKYESKSMERESHRYNIISDTLKKDIVTDNITGDPIRIESRSQERRILAQHGVCRYEDVKGVGRGRNDIKAALENARFR